MGQHLVFEDAGTRQEISGRLPTIFSRFHDACKHTRISADGRRESSDDVHIPQSAKPSPG